VMGALQAAMSGASVASMAAAGALAAVIGTRSVFFAAGGIVVAAGLLAAVAYRTVPRVTEGPGSASPGPISPELPGAAVYVE